MQAVLLVRYYRYIRGNSYNTRTKDIKDLFIDNMQWDGSYWRTFHACIECSKSMETRLLLNVLSKEKVGGDKSQVVLLGPLSGSGAGDVGAPGGSVRRSLGRLGALLVEHKDVSVLAGLWWGSGAHVGDELLTLGQVELDGGALGLGNNTGLETRHNVVAVLGPLVVGSRGGIGVGQNQSVGAIRVVGERGVDGGLVLGVGDGQSVSNGNHVLTSVGDFEESVGVELVDHVGDDLVLLESLGQGGGNSNLG